jgi:hypothetical protein
MAATKRNAMLIEEARQKIKTTQLINRLQNHVLGKVKMEPTQVRAVEILLKKAVPDLAAIELSGNPDAPLQMIHALRPELTKKLDRLSKP